MKRVFPFLVCVLLVVFTFSFSFPAYAAETDPLPLSSEEEEEDGGAPASTGMFDTTVQLGKTLMDGIWSLFGIYVPGFSFTFGQMWVGVLLASVSILVTINEQIWKMKKRDIASSVIMGARPTTKHERECLVEIITPREQIRKFFFEKHFDFLTSVPQQRLQEMILSSCMKGHSGKMSDYGGCGPVHRTTYGHFLAKGKWNDERLEETQNERFFRPFRNFRVEMEHLFLSASTTRSCPKQCLLQRQNVRQKGPGGTTPTWREKLSMDIRSTPPSLGPGIPHCVIP